MTEQHDLSRINQSQQFQRSTLDALSAHIAILDETDRIITVNKAKAEAAPVQVYLLVKEALKMLRAALPSSIEIEQEILSFGEVLADPELINQIIMKLCTNAYQAMREKGVLGIRLEEVDVDQRTAPAHSDLAPGPYMSLTVSDTGIGKDASTKCRISDPYFTTNQKGEGSGLGLAVVCGIVKAYRDHVTVDSRPGGEGASFTVLLPLLRQPEKIEPREATVSLPAGNPRILFVDDEPALLRMTKRMLEKVGYRVDVLSSSNEALVHFKKNPDQYDMVISDMTMPRLTGDQLAMEIFKIRPKLPVIICTGFSELIDKKRAAGIGIRALVKKPFDRHELIRAVREAL